MKSHLQYFCCTFVIFISTYKCIITVRPNYDPSSAIFSSFNCMVILVHGHFQLMLYWQKKRTEDCATWIINLAHIITFSYRICAESAALLIKILVAVKCWFWLLGFCWVQSALGACILWCTQFSGHRFITSCAFVNLSGNSTRYWPHFGHQKFGNRTKMFLKMIMVVHRSRNHH